MENKSLQVKKENLFTKVINFVKMLFKNKKDEVIDTAIIRDNTSETIRSNLMNERELEEQENPELLKLQQQFENAEIDLSVMSNEEVHELNALYSRQINELKKKVDNKKTELNMMKYRIKSYLSNM